MYLHIKKYNKRHAINFQNNFLVFQNKCHIFFNFSCCLKILKVNPKSLRINPKRIKAPKMIKETPIMFQQKLEILLNKNSPLRVNLSFSFSLKLNFLDSKKEFYAISLPYII